MYCRFCNVQLQTLEHRQSHYVTENQCHNVKNIDNKSDFAKLNDVAQFGLLNVSTKSNASDESIFLRHKLAESLNPERQVEEGTTRKYNFHIAMFNKRHLNTGFL